jgi:hypothetical protein
VGLSLVEKEAVDECCSRFDKIFSRVPRHAWKSIKIFTFAAGFMTAGAIGWEAYEDICDVTIRERIVLTTLVRALAAEKQVDAFELWRKIAASQRGMVENMALMSSGQAQEAIDKLSEQLFESRMRRRMNEPMPALPNGAPAERIPCHTVNGVDCP